MTRVGSHGEFPPATLRQYALIADGERGALCGPHGELVWMCAPHWHDEAVFATLLGGAGAYAVTPAARAVWGGYYDDGSLIWHNCWTTEDNALIECRDALARPADSKTAVVMRRVSARRASRVRVLLDARAGFGAEPMRDVRHADGAWTARTGALFLRWTGADEAVLDADGRLVLDLELPDGGERDLVLELGTAPRTTPPPRADELWRQTERSWREDMPSFEESAAPRDTAHAYAVLRGLTASTGAMVAAATTSLPEQTDNGSNYDYRYAWVRDQAITGVSLSAAGPLPLVAGSVRIATARLLEHGPDLRPAYTVNGDLVPDESTLALAGYPGADAVVGNRANLQFQLDVFGECLQLLARGAELELLDADGLRAAEIAVRTIRDRWDDKDAGIWELHDEWWAQSRLSCIAGLRAWSDVAGGARSAELTRLADELLGDVTKRCVSRTGAWRRTPHDDRVDAALLLPLVRGATPSGDPRTIATMRTVRRDLMQDGYVYRFAPRSGELGSGEGAFLFCGFLMVLAELRDGIRIAAWRCFERHRASCGPPGLFTEEFDVRQRQLRGNLPQAFVHGMAFEASVRLAAD